ncbi:MAG: hypothetical protein HKN49_06445, partial [Gammaproteobacteria bacterium]|nr:hypothetical protein [Gammaproteobacteria bacterium]
LVRPSIALEQPRGEADNLQRIRGIGPVLEQRLNEIGVFHFDQLANLTDEDVELVTLGLRTIPGRIDRDDWIGQATELTTATDDQRSRK